MPKFVPLTDENDCPFYVNTDHVITVDTHGTMERSIVDNGRQVEDVFVPEAGLFDVRLGGGPEHLRLVTVKFDGTLGELVAYLLNPDVANTLRKKPG